VDFPSAPSNLAPADPFRPGRLFPAQALPGGLRKSNPNAAHSNCPRSIFAPKTTTDSRHWSRSSPVTRVA